MNNNFLESRVRSTIVTDIVNVAKFHSSARTTNAGWYSVPREVFCMVDFLGAIAYNNNRRKYEHGASTRKSVRFIKEFFPTDYSQYANILIAMWRHGTVHTFLPIEFYVMNGKQKITIEWTSNRSNARHNRDVNMSTFDAKDKIDTVILSINTCQLADDLLLAFDKFLDKIKNSNSYMNGCNRRLNQVVRVKNCMKLHRTGLAEKEKLREQIILAKRSTKGKIDSNLQVRWYK